MDGKASEQLIQAITTELEELARQKLGVHTPSALPAKKHLMHLCADFALNDSSPERSGLVDHAIAVLTYEARAIGHSTGTVVDAALGLGEFASFRSPYARHLEAGVILGNVSHKKVEVWEDGALRTLAERLVETAYGPPDEQEVGDAAIAKADQEEAPTTSSTPGDDTRIRFEETDEFVVGLRRRIGMEVSALKFTLPQFDGTDSSLDHYVGRSLWRLARLLRRLEDVDNESEFHEAEVLNSDASVILVGLTELAEGLFGINERDQSRLRVALSTSSGLELDPFLSTVESEHPQILAHWRGVFEDCRNRGDHAIPDTEDLIEGLELFDRGTWDDVCPLHRGVERLDWISSKLYPVM